jgi:hypothetical protein
MQIPSLLPALLLLLAPTISARCFPTSERQERWSDKNDAKDAVRSSCKLLAGDFTRGEQKMYCVDGRNNGQRYEFTALMDQDPENKGVYQLREEECYDRF